LHINSKDITITAPESEYNRVMPARKVWGDFVRLEDRHGPAKQQYAGTFTIDTFARWACPHCSIVLEARAKDAIDKKSDVCKDHFWGKTPCSKRPVEDVRGKPKTKPKAVAPTDSDPTECESGPPQEATTPVVYDSENTTAVPVKNGIVLFDSEEIADEATEYFLSQTLASDALMRRLHPENRAFAYILEMHLAAARARETTDPNLCVDITQFDLMRQCLAAHSLSDAYGVVRGHFGDDNVDETLRSAVARLLPRSGAIPEAASCADPDLALSVAHLHSACHRIGVKISSRSEMEATYLGQYAEVQEAFAGKMTVSRQDMSKWLSSDSVGKKFWLALCGRVGYPAVPFDGSKYDIEHLLNQAWGGADHYLNFCVIPRGLNRCLEFTAGPGECKMALLGRKLFGYVQRFARWNGTTRKSDTPADAFLHLKDDNWKPRPCRLLHGKRQLSIEDTLSHFGSKICRK
jgi:hypothetical protein